MMYKMPNLVFSDSFAAIVLKVAVNLMKPEAGYKVKKNLLGNQSVLHD